ncbi:MAG: YbaK/EbsC family protein [Ruminococcaceae bacterium]|nr:YbaK/EbsC family protein [Oscillospiraceae bacterium]
MSLEKVKSFFEKHGIADRIIEFSVSSATVALAAEAIGCEPMRIAKTLAFNVDGECVLIVASGDAKVDNGKFKAFFKTKAKMYPFLEVAEICGHAAGGVCPFAVNEGVKIYLDQTLKRFETVFPAAGSSNSVIELSLEELEKYADYIEWIDVCKIAE